MRLTASRERLAAPPLAHDVDSPVASAFAPVAVPPASAVSSFGASFSAGRLAAARVDRYLDGCGLAPLRTPRRPL
jgi:hypothetical protein